MFHVNENDVPTQAMLIKYCTQNLVSIFSIGRTVTCAYSSLKHGSLAGSRRDVHKSLSILLIFFLFLFNWSAVVGIKI